MRKLALIVAIALLPSLGACASINNPINRTELYNAEAAYGLALSAAVGYRRLCVQRTPSIYPQCRAVVPKLQAADRKVQGAVAAVRAFVKDNPTVTPVSLIAAAQKALADFQAVEAQYGVK